MPDTKITALTALTAADPANDVLPIVDVSDTTMAASGTTKKISINNVLGCSGTATLASATITGNLTVQTNKLFVSAGGAAVGTTSIFADFQVQRSTNARLEIDSAAASLSYQVLDNARTGYLQHNVYASQHLWFNGLTEAMRLNSTGLGVGQVPSTSKLEVGITNTSTAGLIEANALKIENNNATVNNAAGLFLSQTGNAGCGIAGIATSRTGGSRTSDLVLYYYNQATSASPIEGLRLTASGNVGIGVTPSARFHSKAGAVTQGGIIETSGANALLSFADAGTSSYTRVQIGSSGNNLAAFINSVQSMTLDASGNLGIGVTSPAAKLHVEGSGPQARFSVATAVDARHEYYRNGIREGLVYWDANLIGLYATQSSGELVLASANTIRVRINSAGDTISNVTATPPTLSTNRQMVFNLTSDTNLRISVRGSDGTTRTANITLA